MGGCLSSQIKAENLLYIGITEIFVSFLCFRCMIWALCFWILDSSEFFSMGLFGFLVDGLLLVHGGSGFCCWDWISCSFKWISFLEIIDLGKLDCDIFSRKKTLDFVPVGSVCLDGNLDFVPIGSVCFDGNYDWIILGFPYRDIPVGFELYVDPISNPTVKTTVWNPTELGFPFKPNSTLPNAANDLLSVLYKEWLVF